MKKNILYLLLLTLFGGILIVMNLPTSSSQNVLETYTMGYLTILSGPFSVWFLFSSQDILLKIIASVIGFIIIALWFYMIKKEYAFWKVFILLFIWAFFGMFFLFAEITSHI